MNEYNFEILCAIYINDRKDATLAAIESSGFKFYSEIEIEEQNVVVSKLEVVYLIHLRIEDCKDETNGKAIYKAQENTNLLSSL